MRFERELGAGRERDDARTRLDMDRAQGDMLVLIVASRIVTRCVCEEARKTPGSLTQRVTMATSLTQRLQS